MCTFSRIATTHSNTSENYFRWRKKIKKLRAKINGVWYQYFSTLWKTRGGEETYNRWRLPPPTIHGLFLDLEYTNIPPPSPITAGAFPRRGPVIPTFDTITHYSQYCFFKQYLIQQIYTYIFIRLLFRDSQVLWYENIFETFTNFVVG